MADARTPDAPADPGQPATTAEDVAYARDLVAELHTLNALAAAIDHTCTPRWWPHRLGEHWTCECGHGYHVALAKDIDDSADTCICGQYGWQSDD